MANQEHLDLLKREEVWQWNRWRKQHPEIKPDLGAANLIGANLQGAQLSSADFSGARLRLANLSGTNLSGALFYDASLLMTNLSGADLRNAHFGSANLSGVNFNEADLSNANLSNANLSVVQLDGAKLYGVITGNTTFAGVDFRTVKGLAEIQHRSLSHIVLHTVDLPRDGSALHFLYGAGVPDEWIDFYRTTMMHPIQYHSCFISYSSQDDIAARRLHADLQDHGVRCWFSPEDMKTGDKLRPVIDQMIHKQEKFLLLLSEHAIESGWVEDEVEIAYAKEREQKREVLFPVRLDDAVMATDRVWAKKLRDTRYIGDFTDWTDPQAYEQAFKRLLRDLREENRSKGDASGKSRTP